MISVFKIVIPIIYLENVYRLQMKSQQSSPHTNCILIPEKNFYRPHKESMQSTREYLILLRVK